jgi:hypothetical protein
MRTTNQGALYVAVLLIGMGLVFLSFNLIPGFAMGSAWPVVFYILAAGFYLPPILWRDQIRSLAGLFIPASIMLTLGLLFTYNVLTQDWSSWGYAWTLIVAGVGGGMALAGWTGHWGSVPTWVGNWMLLGSLALFALFASIFGQPLLRLIGPALIIIAGILLMTRRFRPLDKTT